MGAYYHFNLDFKITKEQQEEQKMDTINNLRILDIKPQAQTRAIIIWLHGLGASANDFEPVLPIINEIIPGIRYIFPSAPLMSVSVNGGMTMPAWYDIAGPDLAEQQDFSGINASCDKLEGLVSHYKAESGGEIPVFIAGFSQGGVIALTTALTKSVDIRGVLALSAYLPELQNHEQIVKKDINLLMMHGISDPVVPITHAKESFKKLTALIAHTQWIEYPMEHTLVYEEIQQIGTWLKGLLSQTD